MHRCTSELRCFLSRCEYPYLIWDIAVSQSNKIILIKNKQLLYQHSENITVLISFMTPNSSTSLFLVTVLRPFLVLLRMLLIRYFSRWQHEHMLSSIKLQALGFHGNDCFQYCVVTVILK